MDCFFFFFFVECFTFWVVLGGLLAQCRLLLSFVLANVALTHRKLESNFSAKAAESTTEIKSGGGGG